MYQKTFFLLLNICFRKMNNNFFSVTSWYSNLSLKKLAIQRFLVSKCIFFALVLLLSNNKTLLFCLSNFSFSVIHCFGSIAFIENWISFSVSTWFILLLAMFSKYLLYILFSKILFSLLKCLTLSKISPNFYILFLFQPTTNLLHISH